MFLICGQYVWMYIFNIKKCDNSKKRLHDFFFDIIYSAFKNIPSLIVRKKTLYNYFKPNILLCISSYIRLRRDVGNSKLSNGREIGHILKFSMSPNEIKTSLYLRVSPDHQFKNLTCGAPYCRIFVLPSSLCFRGQFQCQQTFCYVFRHVATKHDVYMYVLLPVDTVDCNVKIFMISVHFVYFSSQLSV